MKHGAIPLVAALLFCGALQAQQFTNVAPDMGIVVMNYQGGFGSGMSLCDFNGDGWDDLTVGLSGNSFRFFLNEDGEFINQPWQVNALGTPKMVLWVDVDNDGDQDFFFTQTGHPVQLWEKTESGGLVNQGTSTGLPTDGVMNTAASWGDYDLDGDLDVYIASYLIADSIPAESIEWSRNRLFRNDGAFQFVDVTDECGLAGPPMLTLATLFFDANNDGLPDLMVANDKTDANYLYLNEGDGTFSDVSSAWGFDLLIDAMTLTEADFNHDGLRDILITNTPDGQGTENTVISLDPLAPSTTDITDQHFGEAMDDRYMWGGCWMDVDNDVDLDLFIAEHDLLDLYLSNPLYLNAGPEGAFEMPLAPDSVFATDLTNAHVVARGDWNQDGWVDFAVHNIGNHKLRLWENGGIAEGAGTQSLGIFLQGTVSNTNGIGAWIEVYFDHPLSPQSRYTYCGQDFLGQPSHNHHFGLGSANAADSVVVRWPSGIIDTFVGLNADSTHTLTEGMSLLETLTFSVPAGLCAGDSALLTASSGAPELVIEWLGEGVEDGDEDGFWALEPGVYSYEVTWSSQWPLSTGSFTVEAFPEPLFALERVSPLCHASQDGIVSVTPLALDGSATDTEGWTTWLNGEPFNWLIDSCMAGDYDFSITNPWGCESSLSFPLTEPEPISLEWLMPELSCHGDSGLVVGLASGGSPPFYVELDASSPVLTDSIFQLWMSEGSVELIAIDAAGCADSVEWTLTAPPALSIAVIGDCISEEETSCWVEGTVEGGTPPWTWDVWLSGAQPTTTQLLLTDDPGATAWLSLPEDGWVQMSVTDSLECVATSGVQVTVITDVTELRKLISRPYPNPAQTIFRVETEHDVRVVNTLGQVVYTSTLQDRESGVVSIFCRHWPRGFYSVLYGEHHSGIVLQ